MNLRSLREDSRGVMYCVLSDGERARFSPRALQQLSEHAVMEGDSIYIDKTGEKVVLGEGRHAGGDTL